MKMTILFAAEIHDKVLQFPNALAAGLGVAFLGLVMMRWVSRVAGVVATVLAIAVANGICLAALAGAVGAETFGPVMGPAYAAGVVSAASGPGLVVLLLSMIDAEAMGWLGRRRRRREIEALEWG